MRKKLLLKPLIFSLFIMLCGCAKSNNNATDVSKAVSDMETSVSEKTQEDTGTIALDDGTYLVKFDTDNSMFHVNEAMEGKAKLTVKDGKGNLHLVMPSKNVLNLYLGLAKDAIEDEANWINPTTEEVTYSDGMVEEVFAFDVPVNVLDAEFDLALIGKKKVWYDHKVSITDPQKSEENAGGIIELSFEGGTGKVTLTSPTPIEKTDEGYLVTIEWSSKNYDYMIVDNVKYDPVEVGETSVFKIPVKTIDEPLNVIADTVAMSKPHEIEYTIIFNKDSLK